MCILQTDPNFVHRTIVDGIFYLHLIQDPPTMFGDTSKFILRSLCKFESDEIRLSLRYNGKPIYQGYCGIVVLMMITKLQHRFRKIQDNCSMPDNSKRTSLCDMR